MKPALNPGDIVLGKRRSIFKEGDVVMFDRDTREVIKRVSKIENNKVYVLGDNPTSSTDSRHYGWIEESRVKAKVVWPKL